MTSDAGNNVDEFLDSMCDEDGEVEAVKADNIPLQQDKKRKKAETVGKSKSQTRYFASSQN